MDVAELLQTYFTASGTERLAREVGLSAADADRVLRAGLPLHLGALADHARTPEGQAEIGEALESLPAFARVEDALSGPQGPSQLQQAGALLASALLGDRDASITARVAGSLNTDSVQRLLHLSLPLVLSLLGQRGLTAADLGRVLTGAARDMEEGGAGERTFQTQNITAKTGSKAAEVTPAAPATPAPGTGPLTPEGLLDLLRSQFGGAAADRLGRAAGFSGGTASRATLAALPLVVGAIANRASTAGGAADLLGRSRDFERLTGDGGSPNIALLNDAAEVARVEGQGRGVLGPLFPNVERVTGRLGSAVGGSGANAARLLALLTPLVLGLIGRRVRTEGLDAAALGRLLSGLRGSLPGLFPPGTTALASLLEPMLTETVVAATPTVVTMQAPPRPGSAPPPPPTPPTTVVPSTGVTGTVAPTVQRRRGFPWWLIPLLLLLLLGGYWFLRSQPTTTTVGVTTAGEVESGIRVTSPVSGATVPADDFVMRGTGPAGTALRVKEGGQQIASPTVGADGTWEAAIPAPSPGEHTYTVSGAGSARTQVKVTVTEGGARTTSIPPNGRGLVSG